MIYQKHVFDSDVLRTENIGEAQVIQLLKEIKRGILHFLYKM
jgi:hypothetical protein